MISTWADYFDTYFTLTRTLTRVSANAAMRDKLPAFALGVLATLLAMHVVPPLAAWLDKA